MTDTNVVAETAKVKKAATAMRDWLDIHGNPVDAGKESEAIGLRYVHLATAKRLKPDYNPESDSPPAGASFDKIFPAVGQPVTPDLLMCGIFGGLTLAGNVVNTATNGPKGDPNADVITLINERFAELASGVWADRSGGVGGIRYDREKLAQAIANAKGETDPAPYLARMDEKVDPKSGAKVAPDTKGAISYGARAMRNGAVKTAYDTLAGTGADLASI